MQARENISTENERQKRRRLILLIILLFLFVAVTSCIVGYILGQRTGGGGKLIDTIVLTPQGQTPAELPLSLCGRLVDNSQKPLIGCEILLESSPRYTTTDSKGRFFFYDVEKGEHSLSITDEAGRALASLTIKLDENVKASRVQGSLNEGYVLTVSPEVLLVEIELELDEKGKLLYLSDEVTTVLTEGRVVTSYGEGQSDEGGLIFTPQGISVLSGGVINIPFDGVILGDGTYIAPDGTLITPEGASVDLQGNLTTPEGITLSPTGEITLSDGVSLNINEENLPAELKRDEQGNILLPDGTKLTGEGIVTPGGIIITEGEITFPDEAKINSSRTALSLSDGTNLDLIEKKAVLPDGSTAGDNTLTLSDGTLIDNENNTVTTPGGAVIKENGDILLPDGTLIDTSAPKDYPGGGAVNPDGSVSLPDGTLISPTGQITTPGNVNIDKPVTGAGYIAGESQGEPLISSGQPSDPEDDIPPAQTPSSGDSEMEGMIDVREGGVSWKQLARIGLFDGSDKLAPGSFGTYSFNVVNPQSFAVRFMLSISEERGSGADHVLIPFLYRLKVNGSYVSGNGWLTAEDIGSVYSNISANGQANCLLEWKWPYEGDDKTDTLLGESGAMHIINLTVQAESII
ncbi:MAG: carboxypeptidase-like regulatory domain-containing protein [Eubacteriaceae bacterium]|nr:carboxypeptidase-like regulatory domain-containing protein [Eubacteriaceae bacterium]